MRRHKAVALSMATAVAASLGIGASASAQAAQVDPEYVYSVVDDEDAGAVAARAEEALGARYVDLWISADQRSYVVGVLNLKGSEVARLASPVERVAPITLVDRRVSREQVDRAVTAIDRVASQPDSGVLSYGPDYEAGVATVDVEPGRAAAFRSKLEASTKAAGLRDVLATAPAAVEITIVNGAIAPQPEPLG